MAVAAPKSPPLTYEEYMAEPEIARRYDIIEGVRYFMSSPTWQHQRIQFHIARLLERYGEETGRGYALTAAFDLLIRRSPRLQMRQPDVLFITHERLAQGGGIPKKGPLTVGPELVVEIISDTERASMLAGKLADYGSIGVKEAWIVRPEMQTVEVVRVSTDSASAVFTADVVLRSFVFPDLSLPVAEFFKP